MTSPNTEALYLLVKRGLYYRPDAKGYTGIKDHAGRYTKEVAEGHADPVSGVTMVREDEAEEFSAACFDDLARDHLQKKLDAALVTVAALEDAGRMLAEKANHAINEGFRHITRATAAEARADRLAEWVTSAILILTPEPGDKPLTEREKTARQYLAALQQEPTT